MVETVTTILRRLRLLLALFAVPSGAFAHRLDEYLQATRVAIEPAEIRLQIDLTPGVDIADKVIALIDGDHDGIVSPKETAAYASSLERDLTLRLDGREMELVLIACQSPSPAALRTGSGTIQIELSATPPSLKNGRRNLAFENRHLPAISVYLFNALQSKSGVIAITRQERSRTQSAGEIEFTYHK